MTLSPTLGLLDDTVMLADGAIGTNLLSAGLSPGSAPEGWLEDRPDAIAALHHGFVAAGSDIILTASFGANPPRLSLWGAATRCFELNRRAAELARQAADRAARRVFVAGSLGPTWRQPPAINQSIEDDGETAQIYAEQIAGLQAGGADFLWLETMVTASEARAAAKAAIAAGLAYVATASFGSDGLTPAGLSPAGFAAAFDGLPVPPLAIGANCCEGPGTTLASAGAMLRSDGQTLAVKASCGLPVLVDGKAEYAVGPAAMAAYARRAIGAGARIVGGCCGTTPDHVRSMRQAIDDEIGIWPARRMRPQT
ncbi:homocysteine S-methyltransferase family protein [Jiella mangrovi]|uniref:Homocysteine S-methyltransferase family protein n=1 Tax=Jiella mangrovi TaxID=2821407 RepID=A0ABS4BFX2_9HYPH|nr:homocysteine S-methyltransferase family protein [Jiella mangrovi]MBP0615654.1 homocysteine S-methyltransferase family protein [Jiella mangrovi]